MGLTKRMARGEFDRLAAIDDDDQYNLPNWRAVPLDDRCQFQIELAWNDSRVVRLTNDDPRSYVLGHNRASPEAFYPYAFSDDPWEQSRPALDTGKTLAAIEPTGGDGDSF